MRLQNVPFVAEQCTRYNVFGGTFTARSFCRPLRQQHHTTRAVAVTRGCATIDAREAVEEQPTSRQTRPPLVHLRDIFAPKRLPHTSDGACAQPGAEGPIVRKRAPPLHRLDRLQQVANLALEDREGSAETWGLADIGTDHGLLAICLHANGAGVVIAGDRAAGPLDVAKENIRSYLRLTESSLVAAPARRAPTHGRDARRGTGRGNDVGIPRLRLECRLGDGLAVLEEGDVDTVCIAGVGVKTMLQILSGSGVRDSEIRDPKMAAPSRVSGTEPEAALSAIGIQRLVLQPMDARLEYLRCLRVWLRENGWHITQETIVSTLGKGGRRAFITLRAESAKSPHREREGFPAPKALGDWPGGYQEQSDWLGDFLPARTTDPHRMRGAHRRRERRETLTFLAYLRHQRDWIRAIECARSPKGASESQSSGGQADGVGCVLIAVEEAIRAAGEVTTGLEGRERLVTSKRRKKQSDRGGGSKAA